jgi:hypothetical protein
MVVGGTDQTIPGPLLLQAASASLAVLRGAPSISPVIKAQLRQAAQDLREAVSSGATRRDSVEQAAASLRGCMELIRGGVSVADDQRLLDGIAAVLAYLIQFLGGPPAPIAEILPTTAPSAARPNKRSPLPVTVVLPESEEVDLQFDVDLSDEPEDEAPSEPALTRAATSPRGSWPIPTTVVVDPGAPESPAQLPALSGAPAGPAPRPRLAISPDTISPMLALQLVRIERLYLTRAACIDDPSATLGDLQAFEDRIRKLEAATTEVLLAEAGAGQVTHAKNGDQNDDKNDDKSDVSSVGAWWLLGEAGQLEKGSMALAPTLATLATRPEQDQRIAFDVLRLNPLHASPTDVWAVLRGPALLPLRARCLPLLFQDHLPDGEALVRMLDEAAMAMSAAAALGWCRIRDGSRRLLEKALACPMPELADALWFASVTQGDREALSEVRLRLTGGAASRWLIDGLAVAGDESDAHLLLDGTTSGELPAEYALWAIAHLGASSTLGRMQELKRRLHPTLVDRAIALISDGRAPSTLPPGRYVDGNPWSASAVARRLASPMDLPLPILRWSALDLAVRTGEAAPCIYDTGSATEHQQVAAQAFATSYAACTQPRNGDWYYFGRSLRSSALAGQRS